MVSWCTAWNFYLSAQLPGLFIGRAMSGQVGKHFTPQDAQAVVGTIRSWVTGAAASLAPAPHSSFGVRPTIGALAQAEPAPGRITWPGAAASTWQPSAVVLGDAPAMGGGQLTSRLRACTSVTELCRFGVHVKDMNIIHLTVGANPKSSTSKLQPSTLNPKP